MKIRTLIPALLALTAAACAPVPKPEVAATPAPSPGANVAPAQPATQAAEPAAVDPTALAMAQRNLKALGYAAGKSGDAADPVLQRAILAFQKDQGLAVDGHLTPAIAEKLKQMRAALLKPTPAERSALFLYSDGAIRRQAEGLIIPTPSNFVSDAPVTFLQPLRPGSQASYHLGHRASGGSFTPVATVTCHASRLMPANLALGTFDVITVDCAGSGTPASQWRATYSPKLGMVLRQEGAGGTRELIAIRPINSDWPTAARTGLDWALTHALETPQSTPVQWSSTAVAPHFDISAQATLAGRDMGLAGRYAALPCRRFEMVETGGTGAKYPGIACQTAPGRWTLPGSNVALASPANRIVAAPSSTPPLRSASDRSGRPDPL